MVFVLLTYGGWNEAAYLSGEVKDPERNMVRALMLGVAVIVVLYLLLNFAYLHALGMDGMRDNAVSADLMKVVVGTSGAIVLSIIVCITAGSTLNGTIFTGARSYYALGRDFSLFHRLGIWEGPDRRPANGLIAQCIITIVLIVFGSTTRDGFEAMVAYTAPVFWLFMFLVAISIIVFRVREPGRDCRSACRLSAAAANPRRRLRLDVLFGAGLCRLGLIIGVVVLAIGIPLILIQRKLTMGS